MVAKREINSKLASKYRIILYKPWGTGDFFISIKNTRAQRIFICRNGLEIIEPNRKVLYRFAIFAIIIEILKRRRKRGKREAISRYRVS